MAWTSAELKAAIQDYLETNEATFVAELDNIIRQAEERILKRCQLSVFKKNQVGSLSQSNQYLSKPDDYLSPYSLAIDNVGYSYLLLKDANAIRELYPDASATGEPKLYASFDVSNFIIGPTPDADYTVELHYFYRPESITTAGTSWLGSNAENALLYGCLVEGYTFLKGDPDLIDIYTNRYREAVSRLKEFGEGFETTDNYRSGRVRKPRT